MRRREFLEIVAGVSTLALAQQLHAAARTGVRLRTLSEQQNSTLSALADALLPESDTPGALTLGVDRFIDLLLTESLIERDRNRFLAALEAIDERSRSRSGAVFPSLSEEQRHALLSELDGALPTPGAKEPKDAPMTAARGYAMVKRLVVYAYFTSPPVAKELLKTYPIIPGRYDGCLAV
ncbi:MAG TPA: gluconate 2-dehydrogenase subunit 3 family protein [Myxococcales bacterium]|nr:gluconate 2-dehydrogenase subunit 3 family protein [Myxococcales bacterium]